MKKFKFNILDVIIVAVIIAALVVGGYFFIKFNHPSVLAGQPRTISFDVEVVDLTEDVAKSYTVGSPIVYGTTNTDNGTITNVKVEPYKKPMQDKLNGKFVNSTYADKYMATVTIKAKVTEMEDGFVGNKEGVLIGKMMPFNGKGFAASQGYIVNMKVIG